MKPYKCSLEDIKKMIASMVILVDSREKKNNHILEYFNKHKISYQVEKLDYGDYSFMIPAQAAGGAPIFFHRDIVIERKSSLEELSSNLAQGRERFEKELLRARNDQAKVYLMVEDKGGYSSIISHRYQTQLAPAAFAASLKTFEMRFGANIQFIDKEYSGYYITATFQYFLRESLK